MDKQNEAMRLMEKMEYEEAGKLFIELIDEEPDNPIRYINFGNYLIQMRKYEEAERFLLKAIELDEKVATAYYCLGNLYYKKALFTESEKMFQHTIRLGLHDSDVYYMLGMTYVKQNNLTLSLPYLQRATELDKNVSNLFQYGLVLAQLNYLEEAKQVLIQVIKLEQHHADALYNLAIIAVHDETYEKALQYLNKTIAIEPNHQLAINAKESVETLLANE